MRHNLSVLPMKLEHAEQIMASVFALAGSSKSKRRATAAMLVHVHEGYPTVISSGVNGTIPGQSNVCENPELTFTFEDVIHAEQNCLNRMEEFTAFADSGDILFCTDSPCAKCLEALYDADVRTVVYAREYRITEHLDASSIDMFCLDLNAVKQRAMRAIERMDEVIATTP